MQKFAFLYLLGAVLSLGLLGCPSETSDDPINPALVSEAVSEVSQQNWEITVQQLSGAEPFTLQGTEYTLESRNSYTEGATIAAQYLVDRLESMGYTVSTREFSFGGTTAQNVIARLSGEESSSELYVIGAHYDSINDESEGDSAKAPGADDNASGTAAVLEAARVLAGYAFKYPIEFVFFGAEEEGLFGSYDYVEQILEEGLSIRGFINVDCVGNSSDDILVVEGDRVSSAWMDRVNEAAIQYSTVSTELSFEYSDSDQVPFAEKELLAYLLIEKSWESGFLHTADDIFTNLTPAFGYQVTRLAISLLAEVAEILRSR